MKKILWFSLGLLLGQLFFHRPVSTNNDVERVLAKYFSGSDLEKIKLVADCESNDTYLDSQGRVYRGEINHHDVGPLQVNEDYHAIEAARLGYDIYSLEGNVAYGSRLYKAQGLNPWHASEACWGPKIKSFGFW